MNPNLNTQSKNHSVGDEVREMFAGLAGSAINLDFVPRPTNFNARAEYSSTRLTCLTDDENTPEGKTPYSI